ncbi:MAG: aromatic acid decarboxylase [Candidatus Hecatellales archaeon]|nr:MAG: aromatic acid decarboxylase [Candidatus Hecatellales archaeon]
MAKKKIIVGVSGASGIIYAVRLLQALKALKAETHLVMTKAAEKVVRAEAGLKPEALRRLASRSYMPDQLDAPLASGDFQHDGMVVAPCSTKTLAGIAHGYSQNLLLRAAEVSLKEGRPLILVVRETPLTLIHLKNMVAAAEAGVTILPACPAFYHKPKTLEALADFVVGKILDKLSLPHSLYERWG